MKHALIVAFVICTFSLPTSLLWGQDPFGEDPFGQDPFGAPSEPQDKPPKQPSTKDTQQRIIEEERLALERKLKELRQEEQIEELKVNLKQSEAARIALANRQDELVENLRQLQREHEKQANRYEQEVDRARREIEQRTETLLKQQRVVEFQSKVVTDLLMAKLTSKQAEQSLEGLRILSKAMEVESTKRKAYHDILTTLAKSDSTEVRNRTKSLIASSFPDLAIAIGQQSSTDFWLPIEAIDRNAESKSVRHALTQRISLDFVDTPLEEIAWYCSDWLSISVQFDKEVDREITIDFESQGVLFGDTLDLVLHENDLAYTIKDTILLIIPKSKVKPVTLVYRVDGLLDGDRTLQELIDLSQKTLGKDQPERVVAVKDNSLIVVADEKGQRKFSAFLAKINATR